MELTDLEICQKVADAEGVKVLEFQGVLILAEGYNEVVNESHSNSYSFMASESKWAYNPLKDYTMCLKFIENHEFDVIAPYAPHNEKVWTIEFSDGSYNSRVSVCDDDLKRAVCLSVIRKSELNNEH